MQRVPAAGRPARDHGDDDLRHEADEPLHLQNVQSAGRCRRRQRGADRCGWIVLVAVPATNALVTAGAERPAAVLGAGAVAGEQHDADAGVGAGAFEGREELIDRVRTKSVAHLRSVERDAGDASARVVVVRDVGEGIEAGHGAPLARVEDLGHSRTGRWSRNGGVGHRSGHVSSLLERLQRRRWTDAGGRVPFGRDSYRITGLKAPSQPLEGGRLPAVYL